MEKIKRLLQLECNYRLPEPILDEFLGLAVEIHLDARDVLVMSGQVDPDIFIVKEGILSHSYFDGEKEKVAYFSLPGTMTFSSHCYYFAQPAYYQVEPCCETVVLRISKSAFDRMVEKYHEFSRWALSMAQCQMYFYEKKNAVINGDDRERFLSLVNNRPEIMETVSMRKVASYLHITQSYLSRLKKELLK